MRSELPPIEFGPVDWPRTILRAAVWVALVVIGWLVVVALVVAAIALGSLL